MKFNKFSLILLPALLIFMSSCHYIRMAVWMSSDMNDYRKFANKQVLNDKVNIFHFYKAAKSIAFNYPLSEELNHNKYNTVDELIDKSKTLSFLVIRNDTIVYEKYFDDKNAEQIFPSFSVSKSYISALIGIAIDEGYIKNVKQPLSDFLSGFRDKRIEKITIENLLNMKTGIQFDENYSNPFGDIAKYYYGRNLKKYIKNLKVNEEQGKKYDYVSVSTILLGLILEKATGQSVDNYLQNKLWQPLGMEYEASLSIDSKKNNTIKAFCCLNARTIDYAKFGRLYLNRGEWNGRQIISKKWIDQSLAYSKDSTVAFYYNYQWRIGNKGDFFAKGALGQFIYVYPAKNIIIVRTANEYGIDNWQDIFRFICLKL